MSTQSVVEAARVQLAQAEAAQREERRAKLIERLAQVRAELLDKRAELEQLSARVLKAQSDLDNARNSILVRTDDLAELEAARPAVADFLPDDSEVRAWNQKRSALLAELDRLRAARIVLPPLEAMRFDGVNLAKRVQDLMFAESSILNELDGVIGKWPSGGVFAPS